MIKIIVHGIGGMMGKTVANACSKTDNVQLMAGIDPFYNGESSSVPIFKNINECNVYADVIIDFSIAKAVDNLILYSADKKIPLVICTTGLTSTTKDLIRSASHSIAILNSANMSIGVNFIANFLKKNSKSLYDANFDIEIVEKHHKRKIDAPSGTALLLANSINTSLDTKLKKVYDRSLLTEKRTRNEIGIHSVRGGTIVGEHSIIFAGNDEVIEIKHTAFSKEVFAVGAISAAKFIVTKAPGLYDMEDCMNEFSH